MTILKYWKLILAGGLTFVVLLSFLYIRHLQSNLKEALDEKQKLEVSQLQMQTYITKTEQDRQASEKLVEELTELAKQVPVNKSCPAPAAFVSILSRL